MSYTKTTWANGTVPALNATNLNKIETGIDEAHGRSTGRCATLVVAANDSSALAKQQADYVCDETDDQIEIQAAIDAANGGNVVCVSGTYAISGDLTIDDCKLIGNGAFSYPLATSSGTVFEVADGYEITIKNGGACANVLVRVGGTYTNTAVTLDSYVNGDDTQRIKFSKPIDNLMVYNPSNTQGTGILIKADASVNSNAIDCASFGNIDVWGFEHGIKLYTNEAGGKNGWINANYFESISVYNSKYLMTLQAVGNSQIIGNIFSSVQLQASADTVDGLVFLSANANTLIDNVVLGFRAWDWTGAAGGGNALRFEGANTKRNIVRGYIYEYSDDGYNWVFNHKDNQGLVGPLDLSDKSFVNLLNNGGFEDGISGWTQTAITITEETSIVKTGSKSAKLTANGMWSQIQQNLSDPLRYQGRRLTFGCWCYAASGNTTPQLITIGSTGGVAGITESDVISKDDSWHWVTVTHEFDAGATLIYIKLFVNCSGSSDTDDVLYVDGAMLVEGDSCPAFSPKPISEDGATAFNSSGRIIHSDVFMDVLGVSATHVRSNEDLSAAIPITYTLDAQPDVPRTLSWAFDTHAQITEYDIEIIGVDGKGSTVTETWNEAAGWSGETNNAFAIISSIKLTSRTGTGVGDTMDIGITDVLGLSNVIGSVLDVFKIKKNNTNATVDSAHVNATYHTYDLGVIGLVATDDFTIWYKSNLNTA